jgi:signal transduction histidine kinase
MLDDAHERTVAVTLHREGDQCRLIIADDGTGATSAKRESRKLAALPEYGNASISLRAS